MEKSTMYSVNPGLYEIWDFHSSENVECGLLGYDVMKSIGG
jgi:hypothetical protein